ncbi:hypothetical protein [Microbacterium allomyrinae]|uniref:Uncharacterized protein n=1 Tax=Microbacterium allomyrinae TaxID=2830666 RepID=A0A9X1S280_9MICO|nr:hypothetical protein [Microbacterium allomyrinae]MCC2031032.1 hypothetical protein [Microbacterium allomyrinae]
MTTSSGYLFGAAIYLGAGMMMLGAGLSEWWSVVSVVIMFVAAAVSSIRFVTEYRLTRLEASGPESGQ